MSWILDHIPHLIAALAWAGVAGYFFWRALDRSESPSMLIVRWAITLVCAVLLIGMGVMVGLDNQLGAFVVPGLCAVGGILTSLIWGSSIGNAMAGFFTSALDGGFDPPDRVPVYTVARVKRNRGDYHGALHAIQEQLEEFPGDFTGQMLIADIQAHDLNDLAAAEMTVERILGSPEVTPGEIGSALAQLADWQMALGAGPEVVGATFQRIVDLLPGSPSALTAAQRIAHLHSAPPAEVDASAGPKIFAVPAGPRRLGLPGRAGAPAVVEEPGARAEALVAQLEQHPLDMEAREQLAILYAGHFHRTDMACEQLEQLIQIPGQPAAAVVRWLNLMADILLQQGRDPVAAAAVLQRIVDEFPGQPLAAQARQRLELFQIQAKHLDPAQDFKLTEGPRNLGLRNSAASGPQKPKPVE